MKIKALFLSFCVWYSSPIQAQKAIAIQLDKMNVLYIGVENPLKVVVSDVPDSNMYLVPSVGQLRKSGSRNYTWLICDTDSLNATLTLTDSVARLPIGVFHFRIKRLPEPVARFGAQHRKHGWYNRKLHEYGGIHLIYENFNFDLRAEVLRYRVEIYDPVTQQSTIVQNEGPRFNAEVTVLIEQLKPECMVKINNILYRTGCGSRPLYSSQALYYTER